MKIRKSERTLLAAVALAPSAARMARMERTVWTASSPCKDRCGEQAPFDATQDVHAASRSAFEAMRWEASVVLRKSLTLHEGSAHGENRVRNAVTGSVVLGAFGVS
jgi:hypothetical protein